MSYTISDIQLSDKSLYLAIIQVAREIKKTNKYLCKKLLLNLNTYNTIELSNMVSGFQKLMINSILTRKDKKFEVGYFLENNKAAVESLIYE